MQRLYLANKYIRLYKAEYLVCSLPVFAVVSNEHLDVLKEFGLPFESEDFYLTLKQQIEFYNKLSRDMGFTSIFSQELTSTPDFIL